MLTWSAISDSLFGPCAAMVSGLAATTVMAAPEDQFEGLTANEAYEFPMMVNPSRLHTGKQL